MGVQLYKCTACGYQFRSEKEISLDELWTEYAGGKQTVAELAASYGISVSTVKRRLRIVTKEWVQPQLFGGGFVHLDATYWGRGRGIMLAIDEASGRPLYLNFIRSETIRDFQQAIESIGERGYEVRGIVIDGKKELFRVFSPYKIQMCQFHMLSIVRRYLTLRPKLLAARELKNLMQKLPTIDKEAFLTEYDTWKHTWQNTLSRRSHLKSGRAPYTHRRLRTAMHSIDFFLPYLFTYQQKECGGMPNTNNKIEGIFTDLKKRMNAHSGMSDENRRRFVCGFFLALEEKLKKKAASVT